MSELLASAAAMLPTSERPVPFRRREDLITERIEYQGTSTWVIKDPVTLKYHRLFDPQFHLLQLLTGQVTLAELRDELQRHSPQTHWTLFAVQQVLADMHQKRLVISDRLGQGRAFIDHLRRERWQTFWQKVMSFLAIQFRGVDPSRLLDLLYPLVSWVFRPLVVGALGAFIAGSWLWVAVKFDAFRQALPEFSHFFAWPNLLYLWVTLAAVKVIHELGHALTCRHFGGECHEIGVMLLIFSPTLYCDVTDAWMMRNKWHRIWIGAAGMCIELFLSTIALMVWWNTRDGTLHQLALNVFFVTSVTTVVFNANPLVRLDGYFMLADFLEIPILRAKADKMLLEKMGEYCLGIEPVADPFDPQHRRGWFVLFAIAASAYRILLTVTIGLFMYNVLKPYRLESLGASVAIASIAGMLGRGIWSFIKMIRVPRDKPLSRFRIGLTLSGIAFCVLGILLIPVPIFVEAPFTLQPRGVRHLYNSLPGQIERVHVRPGEVVESGELLLILVNEEKRDQLNALKIDLDMQQARIESFRAQGLIAERVLAEQRGASLQEQIDEIEKELATLSIHAPANGTVIAAPNKPEPSKESEEEQLSQWLGTPLDQENLGTYVEERTHLCSIAPEEGLEAVVLIDQLDRNSLQIGDTIRLKLDHLPHQVLAGRIREISQRHQEFAPAQLSNKFGGTLPTVTDEQSRERLASMAYEAIVDLDLPQNSAHTGDRGRARKILGQHSLGWWLYRWTRRTLYFRL